MAVDRRHRGRQRPRQGVAAILLLVPLVGAFTVWPCVRVNASRLVVRNPFRTITVPWVEVESLQAGLSVELRTGGSKYQVWALPVSLRQRKRGSRRAMRQMGDQSPGMGMFGRRGRVSAGNDYPAGGPGLRSRGAGGAGFGQSDPNLSWADNVVTQLNEMREQAGQPVSTGAAVVRWTWWIIAPAVVGAVGMIVLLSS
ncbi:PH domain-containing protein [Streptacidiphilus sp. 4-A2]|nr:PH domain-containing protein [Streptacidiphilus sp. 4-A2]